MQKKKICLIGEASRLSHHLISNFNVRQLENEVFSLRRISSMSSLERSEFWKLLWGAFDTFVFSGAAIDPSLPATTLDFINFELPSQAIEEISNRGGDKKFITIGTALENIAQNNAYVSSKYRLATHLGDSHIPGWIHIRTHSLLGSVPPPDHMLLGQLLEALRQQSDFTSPGNHQIREYIHFEQFAGFISDVLEGRKEPSKAIIQVGGVNSILIADLVLSLMDRFNPGSQLHVDSDLAWTSDQTTENARQNDFSLANPLGLDLVGNLIPIWLAS